jgi:hypothetical protein
MGQLGVSLGDPREEQTLARQTRWVAGTPATFATSGEKPWKQQLIADIPRPPVVECDGLLMDFVPSTMSPPGKPLVACNEATR